MADKYDDYDTQHHHLWRETGAFPSSIVNMLAGKEIAITASTTRGCTFQTTCFPVTIAGRVFNMFDTAGLNEGDPKTMDKTGAIRQLYQLVLSLEGGVNLLLFVMRAPRIKESYVQNWRLFYELICASKVPIAIIVTGLETEDVMDEWWINNQENFERCGMKAAGHACITATRGKKKGHRYVFEEEFEESRKKVQQLIIQCALLKAWNVPRIRWFVSTGILCWKEKVVDHGVLEVMGRIMSEEEAKEFAEELERVQKDDAFRTY